ncbi:MAG: Yip1 family protein [Candidatus Methanoperedens sp.]|nr:Yip1 family protein [Candidatus Methanoperedens sp.]
MDIKSYIKEYIRITLASIKTPRKFFEVIKSEGNGYLKPLAYMLISNIVFTAGSFLEFFFLPETSNVLKVAGLFIKELVVYYIILAILFFIFVGLIQLAIIIVKGKGGLNQTFKVLCYSFSPINFAWPFYLAMTASFYLNNGASLIQILFMLGLFASLLYIFYLAVKGIAVTSDVSGVRASAALTMPLLINAVIIFVLLPGLVFPYYSGEKSTPSSLNSYSKPEMDAKSEPIIHNIYVFAGSTPAIDGIKDDKDAWYQGEAVRTAIGASYLTITTKHDFNNIYILMELNGQPAVIDQTMIHLAQDESTPGPDTISRDNSSTARFDNYYMRFSNVDYSYNKFDYISENITGRYKNGIYTLEWQIPMKSGNASRIYIDKFPAQVHFSVTNLKNNNGIWPSYADPNKPETWGNMTILGEKAR